MSSEPEGRVAGEQPSRSILASGMLLVISSPSGGGKGTLISHVLKSVPDVGYSVSFTTRAARPGEVNGRDYFFVSVEKFKRMQTQGELLESAVVHGNLYGTGREQVRQELSKGRDVILEIDVQGAASVKSREATVSIFILPPSFEVLKARLLSRGSEGPEALLVRLDNARREVKCYKDFDYVIINDDAARASAQLSSIIYAERARRERQEEAAAKVLASFPPQPAPI
jgi:guanylate kinase